MLRAVVEKVAKRDKKAETKELVDDWEKRLAGKEAELAEQGEMEAAKAEAARIAAVKAEPEADGAAGIDPDAPAKGVLS